MTKQEEKGASESDRVFDVNTLQTPHTHTQTHTQSVFMFANACILGTLVFNGPVVKHFLIFRLNTSLQSHFFFYYQLISNNVFISLNTMKHTAH